MLTAIIPIDLKRRSKDLIEKALVLAEVAQQSNVKIIFGHNNRGTRYDFELISRLQRYPYVQMNSKKNVSEYINSSLLRNLAFELVDTDYIILLDVDIYPDFDLFIKYKDKIESSIKPFYVLPCLYLTEYGTTLLRKKKVSVEGMKKKFFDFSRKEFLHLASPSSITILKSDDYRMIKGFDERFRGHGYEDFDFLIRLYELHGMLKKFNDFTLDKTERSPLFAVGFRRYLGEACLEVLLEKDMAFHLYHEKDGHEDYYLARQENYKKLIEAHSHNVSDQEEINSTLLVPFVSLCVNQGKSIHDYAIFFDNKPGHIDRFDTFKRRINFLLNK